MRTETYPSIMEYLAHTHSGIAEDVTQDELAGLKNGTIAPTAIAPRYLAELETADIHLDTDPAATYKDLLDWITWETEAAMLDVDILKEIDDEAAALDRIRAYTEHLRQQGIRSRAKLVRLMQAGLAAHATKGEIARAAGISRPTLDAWLGETAKAGQR